MPIDQEARNMARDALARMDTHEGVCAQRWLQSMNTMTDIKHIVGWGIASLISAMAGLIAWLATHPPH